MGTLTDVSGPVNVHDYEALARERLDENAWEYFRGGAGDETTLRENRTALERWKLRPRVLVDVTAVDASTTVLGTAVAAPVLVAPVALQKLAHPDGEAATARAAARAGTIMVLSTSATLRPGAVAEAAPGASRWFQVYVFRDRAVTQSLIDEACEHGFSALVLTVDVPILGRRDGAVRIGFRVPDEFEVAGDIFGDIDPSVSWRDLEWLAGHGLPVVLKGVLTAEDARLAVEHGAAAVVVSNHGGRQLDGVPASIDALPRVVEAIAGRAEVLLDSGVRRGVDVLRALALGARAVLVGRPVVYALAAAGEEGVLHVLELLRDEVELGLRLLGCTSPAEVEREHVEWSR
jgi:isopentenyl diphosphate isomerase/L-lactate dehydrogenase-like FMN-dependent dehydrogenase